MKAKLGIMFLMARYTLREAARQRMFGLLLGLALAFALGARWLREFDFGATELSFIADCGFGAMALFGAALSIVATIQLFLGEIESGALVLLLAKPVGRGAFVLGRFLGVAALLGIYCACLGAVIVAVLAWRQHELASLAGEAATPAVAYSTVIAMAFLQWLKLIVLAALVLLIAMFARGPLFASLLGVFVFLGCQLQALARTRYAGGDSALDWAMARLLSTLPNFQVFTVGVSPTEWVSGLGGHVLGVAGYGFGYTALACGLAAYGFRYREL